MTKSEKPEEEEPSEKPDPSPKANLPAKKKRRKSGSSEKGDRYRLIRAALEDHLIEHARKSDKKRKAMDEVSSTLEEFMDSFIVLGYDYTGESVTLISAGTQQQADSLSTLIQKFVVSTHNPNNPNPPFYE